MLELNKKYKLIGPLVTKVEGIVFNTNSSRSAKMVGYYQYWEKEIFKTLSKVCPSFVFLLLELEFIPHLDDN